MSNVPRGQTPTPVINGYYDPTGNFFVPVSTAAPLPVTVVSASAPVSPSTALAGQFTTSTTAAALPGLGSDVTRKGAILKNIDAVNVIYIGTSAGVTPATGYPLAPGEFLTSQSTAALFAIAGAGTPILAFFADKV